MKPEEKAAVIKNLFENNENKLSSEEY